MVSIGLVHLGNNKKCGCLCDFQITLFGFICNIDFSFSKCNLVSYVNVTNYSSSNLDSVSYKCNRIFKYSIDYVSISLIKHIQ